MDDKRKPVEEYLENARPSTKPRRDKALFLFESPSVAKKFWTKEIGGKLYGVEIQNTPLHRGDMNLTEEIFRNVGDAVRAKELAESYWRGENSANPQIELLVNEEASVVEIICTSEPERRRVLMEQYGFPLPSR
ncbi:MAG TPA: hypothetical protein VHG89_04820 [Verrucomicrobiae bacterium]|nr:hypothetical protein [Verrucomicrobiae bacterium]